MIKQLTTRLLELIENPASGRLSTSDTTLVGAFIVSSVVVCWLAFSNTLTEWALGAYLAAWVAQNQSSKLNALKRDRELKNDTAD